MYMGIIVFVAAIFVGLRGTTFNTVSEKIAKRLRQDYFKALVYKDVSFFDAQKVGDLTSGLNSDIQVIQNVLGTNISMFVRGMTFILLVIILLFVISAKMTGIVFAAFVPMFLVAGILFPLISR